MGFVRKTETDWVTRCSHGQSLDAMGAGTKSGQSKLYLVSVMLEGGNRNGHMVITS